MIKTRGLCLYLAIEYIRATHTLRVSRITMLGLALLLQYLTDDVAYMPTPH